MYKGYLASFDCGGARTSLLVLYSLAYRDKRCSAAAHQHLRRVYFIHTRVLRCTYVLYTHPVCIAFRYTHISGETKAVRTRPFAQTDSIPSRDWSKRTKGTRNIGLWVLYFFALTNNPRGRVSCYFALICVCTNNISPRVAWPLVRYSKLDYGATPHLCTLLSRCIHVSYIHVLNWLTNF